MSISWIVIVAFFGFAGLIWVVYDQLVTLDSHCERATADIEAQLKRRHALLPKLLETMRAFSQQERQAVGQAVEIVAKARAAALRAASPQAQLLAETTLGDSVRTLLTIAESYSELRVSQGFCELRSEIADVEHKLAASRRYLNEAVSEYNATLRQFPANLLACKLRLARRSFYDIGAERALADETAALRA